MSLFDDDHPKKQPVHEIGCDLSLLSADELSSRIEMLKQEIERLERKEQTSRQVNRRPKVSFVREPGLADMKSNPIAGNRMIYRRESGSRNASLSLISYY